MGYKNGQKALDAFESADTTVQYSRPAKVQTGRRGRHSQRHVQGFVNTVDAVPLSSDEASSGERSTAMQLRPRKETQALAEYDDDEQMSASNSENDAIENGGSEYDTNGGKRRLRSSNRQRSKRITELGPSDREDEDSDSMPFLKSDVAAVKRQGTSSRTRALTRASTGAQVNEQPKRQQQLGARQSARSTRHQGEMAEVGENDIFRTASEGSARTTPKPRAVSAREQFKQLPQNDEFRMRHIQRCEACGQGHNFAPLVYCQGCTLAYHKTCLGYRATRDHLVTKVGDGESVLQCRRCIAFVRKREATAPDQGRCSDCHHSGLACEPFRPRKTAMQEQKEREDNEGEDPSYLVDPARINNVQNVLFRCFGCWRAFHFEHLPSRIDIMEMETDIDLDQRFREYSGDWKCKDCLDAPANVSGLIAWKPVDEDNYDPAHGLDINEDEKSYLVRWENMSYFQAKWMPGAWVWGFTNHTMRKAFAKREDSLHPKMRTEDAIPEDFLRVDVVLDIQYTRIIDVDIRTEEVDKARIREVDKALVKYKGLGYEDAVWETPPPAEDTERWSDFVTAYNDWVMGRYVRVPNAKSLKTRLDEARSQEFTKFEKTQQPETMPNGELMRYQIEGLNWLYYKWFCQNNAVLADEMGLGKTIQVIGFIATLIADWNCFPFLVVVPNSTCPNWRREIKKWAPTLRVVAYYGSRESRDLVYKYELFPEGSKDLSCHIVVTSYDAAADENCRRFFRSVPWQGLIVDEGQRLKNDKNLLYSALVAMKCPFRILLTGTPLQNNQRELFNLLQFLDDSYNAARLEVEYANLDRDKITQLHDMIRPFFLRRTKAQVLTFLPPMAQIILPVSMSTVQKKLYRTILAKSPDLVKAIFSSGNLKQNERASLNNILMQLRKCLCHPFVYSRSIEERTPDHALSHRNLVDASSKLKILEVLLPKLQEHGHRVLIFSQFLDMLDIVEDFFEGMAMRYQRLDGSISALQKQTRIDEFNAPDSPLFAFLLSTRAGGVGINLASADTVIILDPDFNPHQDIQALSRAHRIGQTKKVLCFQLVTRDSAEERIVQMGRKKLALDHVLIQEMDADDANENDLVSVLRHGANKIFDDGSGEADISYDLASVERLLDRSQMEKSNATDTSAELQFSTARVWANDQAVLRDEMGDERQAETAPDMDVWAKILKERERIATEEAAAKADAYGRGRRARGRVDYAHNRDVAGADGLDPDLMPNLKRKAKHDDDGSATDFQESSDSDDELEHGENPEIEAKELAQLGGDEVADPGAGVKQGKPKNSRTRARAQPDPTATPGGEKGHQAAAQPTTPLGGAKVAGQSARPSVGSPMIPKASPRRAQHVRDRSPKKTRGKKSSPAVAAQPTTAASDPTTGPFGVGNRGSTTVVDGPSASPMKEAANSTKTPNQPLENLAGNVSSSPVRVRPSRNDTEQTFNTTVPTDEGTANEPHLLQEDSPLSPSMHP